MNNRNITFDGLRVIGLLAIILAHVSPPPILFQLRNFDVPLMVLISGAVYSISSSPNKKYSSYILSRILRLLLPTWIFLSFYFIFLSIIVKDRSSDTIISTFALLDGIGYVWIIRVFILVALISPFLIWVYQKIKHKLIYLSLIVFVYILYEVLVIFIKSLDLSSVPLLSSLVNNYLFYLIPFACISALGIFSVKTEKKVLDIFTLIFSFIYVILGLKLFDNGYIQTQAFKYPPRLYYISYALMVSYLLYLTGYTKLFKNIFETRLMKFIAYSSLWIYLWHIFYLTVWNETKIFIPKLMQNYLVEYLFVLFFAILTVNLQKLIVGKLVKKYAANKRIGSFLKTAFLK